MTQSSQSSQGEFARSETTSQEWIDILTRKIHGRTVGIGAIGLGYVGLSLAVEFAKAGLQVTGIEVDPDRVAWLQEGDSYVQDVKPYAVKGLIADGKLVVANNYRVLADIDAVNICVPTPLSKTNDPDISYRSTRSTLPGSARLWPIRHVSLNWQLKQYQYALLCRFERC
jgi:hypothetical protein